MNLAASAQRFLQQNLSLEDALPTRMPAYVNSAAYLFGVSTLSALAMLIATGLLLAVFGTVMVMLACAAFKKKLE